ncbi:MAG TPA: DNA repair protein RadC [Acetobacteraceae bacterium]|nr:DNA repair protein RadC [Acetobacteraceae bacterium]
MVSKADPEFPDRPPRIGRENFPEGQSSGRRGFAEDAAYQPEPNSVPPLATTPFESIGPQGHRARMRERLLERGADGLADYELLEMLLFFAFKRGDTKPLAKALINRFGSYAGVLAAPQDDLFAIEGVGVHCAAAVKLVQASALRLARAEIADKPVLNNWDRLMAYLTAAMAREAIEQFRILFLDNRNRLIADEVASRGTVNHTQVYAREVLKRSLELHATALILVHNHPSGDPEPSKDDIAMTRELQNAMQFMEIALHDHVIIGKGSWFSFRQHGLMARGAA